MNYRERALCIHCDDSRMIGIAALPETPADTAVLFVVGGPQYRSGSHRQFTLLARHLAAAGFASLRFDYRGMGDSEGEMRNFEAVNDDLRAAVNSLLAQHAALRQVAIWGLCDAASAALYYAHTDTRITRLILLNPWVHSPASAARVRLRHYYLARVMQPAFWRKLLSGKVALRQSAAELSTTARGNTATDPRHGAPGYLDRMRDGFRQFSGKTLVLLSGDDLVAREFVQLTRQDRDWQRLCRSPRVRMETIAEANHTFARHLWRDRVAELTTAFLQELP